MSDSSDERFGNEILSIVPANPGWQVHVQHVVKDTETKRQEVDEESVNPVAAWALVKLTDVNGSSCSRMEPVFLADGDLINATEYKRMHAIYDLPGHDDVAIRIKVVDPKS
ncbi:hypothetical protein ACIP25_11775 [Streptomyces massasporeus]|uniref:hypothetical protein n=1 Tax=Streptomyces massasporeus TaxID=67324 RepID=UPI0038294469